MLSLEFIEPGSPWQSDFCESYNGRMREELLNLELMENALEAQVLIDDWRHEFNTLRPHRSVAICFCVGIPRFWLLRGNEASMSRDRH